MDITSALDDAELAAGAQEADSVLYIGGPPRQSQVKHRITKSIRFLHTSIIFLMFIFQGLDRNYITCFFEFKSQTKCKVTRSRQLPTMY